MLKFKNPYPGFHNGIHRAYEVEEADLFYGRDQDISNLKLRLRQNRLVALLSAPKAGKTSFLKAGVMANFDKNLFNGINGPRWKSVYFTPEKDPILSMARAIVNPKSFLSEKIKPNMEEEVLRKLTKNDYGLIRVAEDIIGDQMYNLLMVVDDFADLFSRKVESKRRDQFVNLITKAIKSNNLGFYCIISMNVDDLSNRSLKEYEDLYKSVMKGNYQLRFLDQMGLKDAIDIPAKIEKSEVEEALSLQLIEELISDNDQLRKLQIYMSKTWFEWKKTHKDKYIELNHFLKATGQRQKVGLKGKASKPSSIKIKGEEDSTYNPLSSGNLVTGSILQEYELADEHQRKLIDRMLMCTLKNAEHNMIDSEPRDLEVMAGILGVSQNDVIKLVNEVSSILTIERKQVDVSNLEAISEWKEARAFIEREEEAVENYKLLADASILHYIEGIDIDSVFSKEQYVKVKLWYDDFQPTEDWAKLYHKQYELAIDLIEKLEGIYGPVAKPKPKAKASKKASSPAPSAAKSRPSISIGGAKGGTKFKIKKAGDTPPPPPPPPPPKEEEKVEPVIKQVPAETVAEITPEVEAPQPAAEELPKEAAEANIEEKPVEKKIIKPISVPKKIKMKGDDGGSKGIAIKKKIVIKKK